MSDIFNDDELITVHGNEIKVTTPIQIHGNGDGDLVIEIHLPTRGNQNRASEPAMMGQLCEHEQAIVADALSAMVSKILDHRFGADPAHGGAITSRWASPVISGDTAKTDVKALMKKGLAIVAGKDKFDA